VAAWRDAPYFTDAERAALALTEAATRLSDRSDPVPDEVWGEAARHYDEPALAALILSIATTNVFNRLNVTTRQVAGAWAWNGVLAGTWHGTSAIPPEPLVHDAAAPRHVRCLGPATAIEDRVAELERARADRRPDSPIPDT